jgi:CO dehydrogenase/acetyl-CoA synthase gamma subunit (corrinoid Fe-S protein)
MTSRPRPLAQRTEADRRLSMWSAWASLGRTGVAIERQASGDPSNSSPQRVSQAAALGWPVILISDRPRHPGGRVKAAQGKAPLLYAATEDNWEHDGRFGPQNTRRLWRCAAKTAT